MSLTFHWRLLQAGEQVGETMTGQHRLAATGLPDLDSQGEFCRLAEQAGMESVLVDISYGKPDPMLLATALAARTERLKFMVAVRSGLLCPTLCAQQVNTFSMLTGGRISLNVVAGHSPQEQKYYGDHLPHDERYARTDEFLAICREFWNGNGPVRFHGKYFRIEDGRLNTPFVSATDSAPYIFIGGGSSHARDLAIRRGSCWMRLAEAPDQLASEIRPVLDAGKEVGLRLSVICRATRDEAIRAAHELIESQRGSEFGQQDFVKKSDSVSISRARELANGEWLTPCLWTGAVKTFGAPAMALVGTPAEVAAALVDYGRVGVTQFILSGWPKQESMIQFGREVLPLVRKEEPCVSA